jgi:hypothetical protein
MVSIFLPVYQDTINTSRPADTIPVIRNVPSGNNAVVNPVSSSQGSTRITSTSSSAKKTAISKTEQVQETPVQENPVQIEKWNFSTNFFVENGLKEIVSGINESKSKAISYGTKQQPVNMIPRERNNYTYDWLLGIFLFLVVLFVWIRIFYSKFFSTLANALVSFQLSVKLFQERNVLLHRVSIILDFIYIIVTSIFIFELIEFTGFAGTGMTGINLFLLLVNILMLYAILRVTVLRMTGSLFLVRPLFSEYIHNTFVINKGLGILLFPVVIMAHYLPYKIIPVMLVLGIVFFSVAILYKSFRAYQIIIRRDIIIFYLILYLCTLEILPLLLGYKFVTSLIQSN